MDARQHETGNLQKNTYFILIYNTYTLLSIDTAYTVRAKKKNTTANNLAQLSINASTPES